MSFQSITNFLTIVKHKTKKFAERNAQVCNFPQCVPHLVLEVDVDVEQPKRSSLLEIVLMNKARACKPPVAV